MTLTIRGETADFYEHGWGVVGEKLGDASTEVLQEVLPLDRKVEAERLAAAFQLSQRFERSWLSTRVSLIGVEPDGTARYVEASNLTHPG